MILHYDKPLKIFAILLAIFFVTPRSSGENQSLTKDGAFEFFESKFNAKASELYPRFEQAVRTGALATAISLQADITNIFTNRTQADDFWSKKIPQSEQRTIVFASFCTACSNGVCLQCNGTKKCFYGVCKNCKGRGICTTCNHTGVKKCTNCGGTGSISAGIEKVSCPHCKGEGQTRGLNDDRLMCPLCLGSGSAIGKQLFKQCGICAGKSFVTCPSCDGKGQCPSCNGTGHNPNCLICRGTGLCPQCKNGKCRICQNSGAIKTDTLLVNVGWLKQDKGLLVYSDSSSMSSLSTGNQNIKFGDKLLSLTIAAGELWCISNTNNYAIINSAIIR